MCSKEKIGVAIGIAESSSRARISRYSLGVHEPPMPTARLVADALGVPLAYMYCEDDKVAALLLALHKMKPWG
jgi:transcriptional regulator with XRE-family HTH domain